MASTFNAHIVHLSDLLQELRDALNLQDLPEDGRRRIEIQIAVVTKALDRALAAEMEEARRKDHS